MVDEIPAVTVNVLVSTAHSIAISMKAWIPGPFKKGAGLASRVAPAVHKRLVVPVNSPFADAVFLGAVSAFTLHPGDRMVLAKDSISRPVTNCLRVGSRSHATHPIRTRALKG